MELEGRAAVCTVYSPAYKVPNQRAPPVLTVTILSSSKSFVKTLTPTQRLSAYMTVASLVKLSYKAIANSVLAGITVVVGKG